MNKAGCIYDKLFKVGVSSKEAIEEVFGLVCSYVLRNFGSEFKSLDLEILNQLKDEGTPILKLCFLMNAFAQDTTLRAVVKEGAIDKSHEMALRIDVFYRVLAIAIRSIYSTPFTVKGSKRILLSAVHFCLVAWNCFDAKTMMWYCDMYTSRGSLNIPLPLPQPPHSLIQDSSDVAPPDFKKTKLDIADAADFAVCANK